MSARNKTTIGCTARHMARYKTLRRKYGEDTAWLWLWLNANPHGHFTGLYSFYPVMAANWLGVVEDDVVQAMGELVAEGLIRWDRECDLVHLPAALDEGSANLNKPRAGARKDNSARVHAATHLAGLPSSPLVTAFCHAHDIQLVEVQVEVKVPCHSIASHGVYDGVSDGGYDGGSIPISEVAS